MKTKKATLGIRITRELKKNLEMAAKYHDISVSAYVAAVLEGVISDEFAAEIDEMKKGKSTH